MKIQLAQDNCSIYNQDETQFTLYGLDEKISFIEFRVQVNEELKFVTVEEIKRIEL